MYLLSSLATYTNSGKPGHAPDLSRFSSAQNPVPTTLTFGSYSTNSWRGPLLLNKFDVLVEIGVVVKVLQRVLFPVGRIKFNCGHMIDFDGNITNVDVAFSNGDSIVVFETFSDFLVGRLDVAIGGL